VRKADYTETSLTTGAKTFASKPTSISYGAVIKPWDWFSIYGTYIEGLESTPGAPVTAANFGSTLPPTESEQREAGIKVQVAPGLLAQAAFFNIERGSAFVNGQNVYVLDGRARFRGEELSLTGEVTKDWSVYLTGQFLDAEQISGADTVITTNPMTGAVTVTPTVVGRLIENTPKRTFSLATEYRFDGVGPGFAVNAASYYVSNRAINAFNSAFIPSYTLFDIGGSYTGTLYGNDMTVRVTGQNVADKKYFSSTGAGIIAQGPPRVIKFSVETKF
jgi:iron complex outermembrane receptor protein